MKGYEHLEYSLAHLSDTILDSGLETVIGQERGKTAMVLAHIAESDERKRYAAAGYPSMHAYCVGHLKLSDDAAFKRIQAARAARQFPAIFVAVADGRLHLTAVGLLAPRLTADSVDELLAAATHKSKLEIERLLVARFPRPDVPAFVRTLPAPRAPASEAVLRQEVGVPGNAQARRVQLAPAQVGLHEDAEAHRVQLAPAQVPASKPSKLTPLAPERFALQVTIGQQTHDKLRRVRDLLGHQVPSGDLAHILDRALDALIAQIEKRKYAATSKPRSSTPARTSNNPRYIPAHVRRTVRQRDGDRCTFVSATGRRCEATARLEFDHVNEVARGGLASEGNIRLRCRTHNQYTAGRTFGAGFMHEKRREARETRAAANP